MLRASVRANLIQPSVFTIFVFRNTMKMKPLFICYPRCSTCQKALKWLQERGIEVEVRDIVQQNPLRSGAEEWIDRSGLAVNRFFNTSGLRYKALNLKEKVRTAPREEAIRVLSTDGMLVKRPLLIASDKILVGFREPEWAAALSEKDRRFRLYRNRKRTEIFRPQGYFFILSGCRSRLILFAADRPAEVAQHTAQCEVFAVRIDDGAGFLQLQFTRFGVDVAAVGLDIHHFGQKQVVRS